MRSDLARRTQRIAVAAVALWLVTNLVTGPGVPQIIGGQPVLFAHAPPRSVNWPVWWLNLALMAFSFVALCAAITFRYHTMSGARPVVKEPVLLHERLLSGTINEIYYSKRINVRLVDGLLDIRPSPFFLPDRPGLTVPLSNLAAACFTRKSGVWSVACETWGHHPQSFSFTPSRARRWYASLHAMGVQVRPESLESQRLPRLQAIVVVTLIAPYLPFAAGFGLLLYSLLRSLH